MPLTLVLGKAGSGKTQALVERATARYRADPFASTLVLVPTGRHADQFRRRFVAEVPAAFGLEVSVIGGWARDTAATTGTRFAGRGVVAAAIREATLAATDAGEAPAFDPIRMTRGLHSRIGDAIHELVAEAIEPEQFTAAAAKAGTPALSSLAAIYTRLAARLEGCGLSHSAAAASLAAATVNDGGDTLPPLVLVDGFDYLHEGEAQLIAALAARTETLVALDPEAAPRTRAVRERLEELVPDARHETVSHSRPAPEHAAFEAPTREAELRAIARDIKDRLTRDRGLRPSDFAVAFRQASPRLSLADQIFREFDLPLDPAAGFALSDLPFGAWARRLLSLGSDGWRLRDLLAVLRSDHVNRDRWEMDRGDLARIARAGRRGHHWGGPASLRAIADGLARPGRGDSNSPSEGMTDPDTTGGGKSDAETARRERELATAEALRRCLDDLVPLLDSAREGTAAAFARELDAALFGPGPIVRPSDGHRAQSEAFRALLRGRVEAEEVLGDEALRFEDLARGPVDDMEGATLSLREAGGVVLTPLHTLHGLRFHHVVLGGLSEGEFPAPRHLPGLLDGEARTALIAARLALPEGPRASEDELFASSITRADATLLFTRPRLDPDGKPRAASHFFPPPDQVAEGPAELRPETAASTPELALALVHGWPGETRRPKDFAAWPLVRRAAYVESRRRSFEPIPEYEGVLPSGLASRLVAPDVRWSASRLEKYVGCPFDFFVDYGLGVRELDDEQQEADAAMTGTVVHQILQEAVRPLVASDRALNAQTLEEVQERIDTLGRELWDSAPERESFGRAGLWRLRRDKTRSRLRDLLGLEAQASDRAKVLAVSGVEQGVDTTIELRDGLLHFNGKIDRLDDADDTAIVVDYKTGRPISRKDVDAAQKLQLQLYSKAIMEQEPRFTRAVARFAYLRPTGTKERFELDTGRAEDRETVDAALERVAVIRERTREGHFEVTPEPFKEEGTSRRCPSYCDLKYICRGMPFGRWKQWDA